MWFPILFSLSLSGSQMWAWSDFPVSWDRKGTLSIKKALSIDATDGDVFLSEAGGKKYCISTQNPFLTKAYDKKIKRK